MDPILGSIMIFAGNFAPKGWFACNGQLLPIAQYSALFSLLGTTYGGNGTTTFALPDLRGRSCIGAGQGAGLPPTELGEMGGMNTVTILTSNLPSAPINIPCSTAPGTTFEPSGMVPASAEGANEAAIYGNPSTAPGMMSPAILQGGNQPLDITSPFLAMTVCIAWQGIYPSRP